MRRWAWVLVLAAGCGGGDDCGRLAPMTRAVVVSPEPGTDYVPIEGLGYEGVIKGTLIEAGSRVMVVGDEQEPATPTRTVFLMVKASDLRLAGAAKGDVTGWLPRNCLRPAR